MTNKQSDASSHSSDSTATNFLHVNGIY